jgi:hypothetical protein
MAAYLQADSNSCDARSSGMVSDASLYTKNEES